MPTIYRLKASELDANFLNRIKENFGDKEIEIVISEVEAVISDAFDLLAAREAEIEQLKLEELRQKIEVGRQQIVRGQVTDGEKVFERIKAKINREYRGD